MAILLTESYQRISTISLTYGEIRTYAKYNSQDNINAYTTYDIKATYYIPTQNYVAFGSGNLTVDGNRIDYGYTTIYKGETTLMEFQRTLQHETDGTSPIKNIVTTFNASFGGSGSTNADVQMPKIARLPVITSLENINDEQNPIIVFTNPAGFYLKAYFYRLSGYEFVRENVASPYTFELTTNERNTIRQFMKNMQSDSTPAITIEAYSSSDFSESSYIGEATKTLKVSITNATPTVSLNVVETNQKVIDVYGGSTATTVVKNVSQLNLSSVVELKKYATLKSRTYTYNDNQTSNDETVTIVPTVNKVSVNVVDSRNLPASASKTLNMVDYLPMVINSYDFFRTSPTSSEIKLNADITYFQGTYNGTANAPIIQYKMGSNGTLRTLTTDDYTLDTTNNKITITNLVLTDTLVYTKAETFYLYVSDIFSSDNENDVVTKGIPTTERGEFDFQVNGDLFIADRDRNNRVNVLEKIKEIVNDNKTALVNLVYPVGSIYMSTNSTSPASLFGGTWEQIKDRFLLCCGNTYSAGATGGEATHKLTINEMPSHGHDLVYGSKDSNSGVVISYYDGGYNSLSIENWAWRESGVRQNIYARNEGGSQAHNNMPPYLAVYVWKRTA